MADGDDDDDDLDDEADNAASAALGKAEPIIDEYVACGCMVYV